MDWEFFILDYIQNEIRTDFLDKVMVGISFLGKGAILWILIAAVCIIFKKTRGLGITLAIDIAANYIAGNLIIKNIVNRIRPCILNNTAELLVSTPHDASFPSGHTMFAFGAATIIFMHNKWYGLAAYIFACLMAFSRVYLYVHFPTDVCFGAVLGICLALVVYKARKSFFTDSRLPQPKPDQ